VYRVAVCGCHGGGCEELKAWPTDRGLRGVVLGGSLGFLELKLHSQDSSFYEKSRGRDWEEGSLKIEYTIWWKG